MCDRRAAIAAVVRANYWFGLFTASGMALTDRLEVSVYAPGVLASDRLIGEEFGGKFAPSHADDHVTTPWVAVAPPEYFERYDWVLVSLSWAEEKTIPRARYFVQRDGFYTLQPSHSVTELGTTRDYFEVDRGIQNLRVVFLATELETVALPQAVSFEGTFAIAEPGQAA